MPMRSIETWNRTVSIRPTVKRTVRWFLVVLFVSSGATVCAQTVEIKIVDGRNGRPMAHRCVNVGVTEVDHMLAIPTDKDGVARLRLTRNPAEVNTQKHWKACGDWGVVDPVVVYGDNVGVNAGYALCEPHTQDYSWLARRVFSTAKILDEGLVTTNACGKATVPPKAGQLVMFVRPLSLWQKLKQ